MAKAKGTTLLGAVKFLRSQRARALELLPQHLHPYLEGRISEASWYPEQDLLELLRAVLRLLPGDEGEALIQMGTMTARSHQEGVYSHLMEGRGTASTSFALWSSMHDTGVLRVVNEGSRRQRIDLKDFGLPSREMCDIVRGYIAEVMRLSGTHSRVEKIACRLDGDTCCSYRSSPADEASIQAG